MIGASEVPFEPQDQAEYLGILGLAPADTVKEFVAAVVPDLGSIDVISVQTGLLRFAEAAGGDGAPGMPPGDVLVTEAHILLSGQTDGYSAVFGGDTLHAVAVAILDAALHTQGNTENLPALQRRIAHFIETQAALLAEADGQAFPQADLLPA